MGELEGKAALITGGSTGLGLATARAYLREGARVVFTARNPDIERAAEADLRGEGDVEFLRADAADVEYSVSKAAVHMLSNMFAIEGGRRGVRSNVIAPGDTEPGVRHMTAPGEPERSEDDPSTWPVPPIGRVGKAADVAEAAVYLASERASFVNGIVLMLDGGMRAGYNTGTFRPKEPG